MDPDRHPRCKNNFNDTRLTFFSGGSGLSTLAIAIRSITPHVTYILPISDDGGSSGALRSILGGPSVGDIRSRCALLADYKTIHSKSCITNTSELSDIIPPEYDVHSAVIKLLNHRLCNVSEKRSQKEWFKVLHKTHDLWKGIPPDIGCIISSFLNHFQNHLIQHISEGARLFFNSLESAVFLFCRLLGVPSESNVVPCITGNVSLDVGVYLEDDTQIIGQNNISHPNTGNIVIKCEAANRPLPSRIKRLFYINSDMQEIKPKLNPRIIQLLLDYSLIVYGMGSLYTSIIPCLTLVGCGEAIAECKNSKKILLLNGTNDRETYGMTSSDYVNAIVQALNRYGEMSNSAQSYITHMFYCEGTSIVIHEDELRKNSIQLVRIKSKKEQISMYDEEDLLKHLMS